MNKPLSELFQVTGRYRRSVHLERDFYADNALDGYVVTVTARETLGRLIAALENQVLRLKLGHLRAPTVQENPHSRYFAAKLLGDPQSPPTQGALNLLEKRGCVFVGSIRRSCTPAISNEKRILSCPYFRRARPHCPPLYCVDLADRSHRNSTVMAQRSDQ